jgi:hypothetical protein
MSVPRKIVWIDDNPGRKSTAADLGAHFINVRDRDPAPELKRLLKGPSPRLVLIDHVLDKTKDAHPVFLRGSTIAEAIKGEWPSCPVIGVTNADKLKGVDLRTQEAYDALFLFQDFARYFDRIGGIARGFAVLAKSGSDPDRLIALLKAPDDDIGRLRETLTYDLKARSGDKSVTSRMYRWVERLMDRPGFLFDSLWSATFLGLNELGFEAVAGSFKKAKYDGIFTRPDDPRWWSAGLSTLLYGRCEPQPGELSWHVGRRLPGVRKEHFSSCHFCKEEFPETVAYLDVTSNERRAMHLRCTELHPLYKRELYFEDIRVMRGE